MADSDHGLKMKQMFPIKAGHLSGLREHAAMRGNKLLKAAAASYILFLYLTFILPGKSLKTISYLHWRTWQKAEQPSEDKG